MRKCLFAFAVFLCTALCAWRCLCLYRQQARRAGDRQQQLPPRRHAAQPGQRRQADRRHAAQGRLHGDRRRSTWTRRTCAAARPSLPKRAYDADVAVVYYAGHGMQVDGQNYLIPIDAELENAGAAADPHHSGRRRAGCVAARSGGRRHHPRRLPRQSAGAHAGRRAAEEPLHLDGRRPGAGAGATDCSHDAGGLLIAYATDPGAVAYDGKGAAQPLHDGARQASDHARPRNPERADARARRSVGSDQRRAAALAQRVAGPRGLYRRPGASAATTAKQARVGSSRPRQRRASTAGRAMSTGPSSRNCGTRPPSATRSRITSSISTQYPQGRFANVARLNIDQLKAEADGHRRPVAARPPEHVGAQMASASQSRTAVGVSDEIKPDARHAETRGRRSNLDQRRPDRPAAAAERARPSTPAASTARSARARARRSAHGSARAASSRRPT